MQALFVLVRSWAVCGGQLCNHQHVRVCALSLLGEGDNVVYEYTCDATAVRFGDVRERRVPSCDVYGRRPILIHLNHSVAKL